jgi:ATP-binding cassette subfamily F protein 3
MLSGGEKARVALCTMMMTPANLLVLDEPTNHLDIPAKEMLEEALQNFDGTVLVISHDRYFISQVANTICAFEDKKLVRYNGDYKFYMEKNEALREAVWQPQTLNSNSNPILSLNLNPRPKSTYTSIEGQIKTQP